MNDHSTDGRTVNVYPRTEKGPNGGTAITGNGIRSSVVKAAEEQAAMQPWFDMECYQLSRGSRLAQFDALNVGSQEIVRETQHAAIQKLGATPKNLCTVSCCTPKPGFRFSEISSGDANAVFFMPGNTEFDIYVPADARTTYVRFDQDEFLRGAQALNPAAWEEPPTRVERFQGLKQAAFSAVIDQVLEQAEAVSASGNAIDADILNGVILQAVLMTTVALSSAGSAPSESERGGAFEVCRKSRAFIEESLALDTVPTIPEVCLAANVSERTLQYAFRQYVGMTPLAYLRVCRLNKVRNELLASDSNTTVTTVALRYGFLHLGRFSGDYQKLFGVPPSKDLAR